MPNRSAIQPLNGITAASASVYPVATHWIVGSVVWNFPASVLIATLTTVVSRIVIIAPSTTTPATTSSARSIGSFSGTGGAGCTAGSGSCSRSCSADPLIRSDKAMGPYAMQSGPDGPLLVGPVRFG